MDSLFIRAVKRSHRSGVSGDLHIVFLLCDVLPLFLDRPGHVTKGTVEGQHGGVQVQLHPHLCARGLHGVVGDLCLPAGRQAEVVLPAGGANQLILGGDGAGCGQQTEGQASGD